MTQTLKGDVYTSTAADLRGLVTRKKQEACADRDIWVHSRFWFQISGCPVFLPAELSLLPAARNFWPHLVEIGQRQAKNMENRKKINGTLCVINGSCSRQTCTNGEGHVDAKDLIDIVTSAEGLVSHWAYC